MGVAPRVAVLVVAMVLAACGGGEEKADEPNCPSYTPGQQAPTQTVDPRCVESATEIASERNEPVPQTWAGTLETTEGGPGMTGTTDGTFTALVSTDGAITGSGTSHSAYSNAPPIDSQISVTGNRDDNSFHLVLTLNPGTRLEVEAPINGNIAEGPINLTGEAGSYSRGHVRLECRDCA
jgi:hypothetical protein